MRYVGAGELQDPLAPESVFEGLFADGALATHKGPLAPRPAAVGYCRHAVAVEAGDRPVARGCD